MFSTSFSFKEFPLLIGITRLLEYEIKPLVKCKTLIRTEIPVDYRNLYNELNIFKEEYDQDEKDLVSVLYHIYFL
jgi:hypothetical protein